ncbi:hypothetical protein SAMN05444722_1996 [Rhodovulum sp. ES.010]|uniref:hypothetical protein n=1 Tax=Rhodovulum sp. ES.010 TaxID=1882821 RepID=UPI000927D344|nr:hypothetical protein [Rhodovulum sp. ES.010]SIO41554.1 hypothetical protein SAMN05444722_1996 [Rhodovulum sp. ES.010]
MTSTPPPLYSPASPFWMVSYMMEQQMRMAQLCFETMMRANPWVVMIRTGSVDPLTADAALGAGDAPDDINLEGGVTAAKTTPAKPAPVVARAVPKQDDGHVAAPAAKPAPAAKAEPASRPKTATRRNASSGAKGATAKRSTATGRAKTAAPKPRAAKPSAGPAATSKSPAAGTSAAPAAPRETEGAKTSKRRARRQPASPPIMPEDKGGPDA